MTNINMQIRVNKLSQNSLRAALFSIEDTDVLEAAVLSGEKYQELKEKISRKGKQE